jgi:hypothetical protein
MDKKTSDRFFNLRVKEKEDLESRMVRYYADFLIITALLRNWWGSSLRYD